MIHTKRKTAASVADFAGSSPTLCLLAQEVAPAIINRLLVSGTLPLDPAEVSPVSGDNALNAVLGTVPHVLAPFYYLQSGVRRDAAGAWGNDEAEATDPNSKDARRKMRRLELEPLLGTLLRAGCDPFLANRDGMAPVDLMFVCDQAAAVEWVLKNKAGALNALRARTVEIPESAARVALSRDTEPVNALPWLHSAALWGNARMLDVLLAAGWPVNDRDAAGNTALHLARHADIAERLIRGGADPSLKNARGATAVSTWQRHRATSYISAADLKRMVSSLPKATSADLTSGALDYELITATVGGAAAPFDAVWGRCGRDPDRIVAIGERKMSLMELACATTLERSRRPQFLPESISANTGDSPVCYIVPRLLRAKATLARCNADGVSDECWLFLTSLWASHRYTKGAWKVRAKDDAFFWRTRSLPSLLRAITPSLNILAQQAQDGLLEADIQPYTVGVLEKAFAAAVGDQKSGNQKPGEQKTERGGLDEVFCALGKIAASKGRDAVSVRREDLFPAQQDVRIDPRRGLLVQGRPASPKWLEACVWWAAASQPYRSYQTATATAPEDLVVNAVLAAIAHPDAASSMPTFIPALRRLADMRQQEPRAYVEMAAAMVSAHDLRSALAPEQAPRVRRAMAGM